MMCQIKLVVVAAGSDMVAGSSLDIMGLTRYFIPLRIGVISILDLE